MTNYRLPGSTFLFTLDLFTTCLNLMSWNNPLTIRGYRVIRLSIMYLRNVLQLLRIPAFEPYSWFCSNTQTVVQPVFLILTYLQYNRDQRNRALERHLVDEVIDIFAHHKRPAALNETCGGLPGSNGASLNRSMSLEWRMLVALRKKIDLPFAAEQPLFKSSEPIRCQLVVPEIALRMMSLSSSETAASSPSTLGSSSSLVPPYITENSVLASIEPHSEWQQYESQGRHVEADDLVDIFDLDTWSLNQKLPIHDSSCSDVAKE